MGSGARDFVKITALLPDFPAESTNPTQMDVY